MTSLSHPVDIAVARFSTPDQAAVPLAVLDRGDTVAVLIDGLFGEGETPIRAVVFVTRQDDGSWAGPPMLNVTSRPTAARPDVTDLFQPLISLSRKRIGDVDPGSGETVWKWASVTGIAAHDAVAVTLSSEVDVQRADIGANGIAFAVVRIASDTDPEVVVHIRDGRDVHLPVTIT